jgi:hypothetical protein
MMSGVHLYWTPTLPVTASSLSAPLNSWTVVAAPGAVLAKIVLWNW